MRAIFCPKCNSTEIGPYIAGISGTYRCRKCGYMGSLVVEKELIKSMKKMEDNEEELL